MLRLGNDHGHALKKKAILIRSRKQKTNSHLSCQSKMSVDLPIYTDFVHLRTSWLYKNVTRLMLFSLGGQDPLTWERNGKKSSGRATGERSLH